MAHGQPVIAQSRWCSRGCLDNVTGIVVQPGNADHLAQAIIRLTVDGSLRASMGGWADTIRKAVSTGIGCKAVSISLRVGSKRDEGQHYYTSLQRL